jgi:hypothetical protein
LKELRKLGQAIANNLNINYFDENNSSDHHVVRHFRPVKATSKPLAGVSGMLRHANSGTVLCCQETNPGAL